MKVIIEVDFEPDPQPPVIAVLPKPTKFIATRRVISSYQIGWNGEVEVRKIA